MGVDSPELHRELLGICDRMGDFAEIGWCKRRWIMDVKFSKIRYGNVGRSFSMPGTRVDTLSGGGGLLAFLKVLNNDLQSELSTTEAMVVRRMSGLAATGDRKGEANVATKGHSWCRGGWGEKVKILAT